MKLSHLFTVSLIITCGTLICMYFYFFQPPNNFSVNEKADANEYLKIYEYFQGERDWQNVRFGIHNRIVIPFLASLFPWHDATFNFFILNTILAILSLVALYFLLLHYNVEQNHIFLILLFFSLQYVGPFRQNAAGPINVDMGVYLFEILFIWFFLKRKYLPLIIIIPVAIATKEIFLALTIVIFLFGLTWRLVFKNKSFSIPALSVMLLIGLITKWMLNESFPSASPERNSILVMAFHIREMILNPDHLWRWVLSLFAAYGGFLFLLVKKFRSRDFKTNDTLIIHILSLSVLALSVLGGMDYTRLIFLGFPYIIISIFLLSNPEKYTVWIAFFISIILARFWIKMPVISMDLSLYNKWMPESANTNHLIIWTTMMIISFGVFYSLKKLLSRTFQS